MEVELEIIKGKKKLDQAIVFQFQKQKGETRKAPSLISCRGGPIGCKAPGPEGVLMGCLGLCMHILRTRGTEECYMRRFKQQGSFHWKSVFYIEGSITHKPGSPESLYFLPRTMRNREPFKNLPPLPLFPVPQNSTTLIKPRETLLPNHCFITHFIGLYVSST